MALKRSPPQRFHRFVLLDSRLQKSFGCLGHPGRPGCPGCPGHPGCAGCPGFPIPCWPVVIVVEVLPRLLSVPVVPVAVVTPVTNTIATSIITIASIINTIINQHADLPHPFARACCARRPSVSPPSALRPRCRPVISEPEFTGRS